MAEKKFKLYAFQARAVRRALDALMRGKRPLTVSPVGSGKTFMIAALAAAWVERGGTVIISTPRRELVFQGAHHLGLVGVTEASVAVVVPESETRNEDRVLKIGTINSILRRVTHEHEDVLLIFDEAHHAAATMYTRLMKRFPSAKTCGFTATPIRRDRRGLGRHFDELHLAATAHQVADIGLIVIPEIYRPGNEDLWKSVRQHVMADRKADITSAEANRLVNKVKLVGDVVSIWDKLAKDRRTLVFAARLPHAQALVRRFRRRNVSVEYVHGNMNVERRKEILKDFATGYIQVLVSVDLLLEGYDLPSIECLVVARPTRSLPYHLQMLGRCMRNFPGKRVPIVLDFPGNTGNPRLGIPERDHTWTLSDEEVDIVISNEDLRKTCPVCAFQVKMRVMKCPKCGHVFKAQPPSIPEELDGLLKKFKLLPGARAEMRARLVTELMRRSYAKKDAERKADQILLEFAGRRGLVSPR